MELRQALNPKIAVLQLLEILLLCLCTYHLVALGFSLINLFMPMVGDRFRENADTIRLGIAVLVTGMPVYLWSAKKVADDRNLTDKNSPLRWYKWLVYSALFIFGVAILVVIIYCLYSFLGGELTGRKVLKALYAMALLGTAFTYYLGRLERRWTDKQSLSFAIAGLLVSISAISAVFFTLGSPFTARLILADQQRVLDLKNLSDKLNQYWSDKGKLPINLQAMYKDSYYYTTEPTDPKTYKNYEFHPLAKNEYELCADFELPSLALLDPRFTSSNEKTEYKQEWQHGKGRTCFHKTLTPSHKKT